jgi:hypothetical protein
MHIHMHTHTHTHTQHTHQYVWPDVEYCLCRKKIRVYHTLSVVFVNQILELDGVNNGLEV